MKYIVHLLVTYCKYNHFNQFYKKLVCHIKMYITLRAITFTIQLSAMWQQTTQFTRQWRWRKVWMLEDQRRNSEVSKTKKGMFLHTWSTSTEFLLLFWCLHITKGWKGTDMCARPLSILLRGMQLPNTTIHIMTQTNSMDRINIYGNIEQPLMSSQINLKNKTLSEISLQYITH